MWSYFFSASVSVFFPEAKESVYFSQKEMSCRNQHQRSCLQVKYAGDSDIHIFLMQTFEFYLFNLAESTIITVTQGLMDFRQGKTRR